MKNKCPQCFRVLSDKNRAKIINYLKRKRSSNVKEINSLFRLRQPTISHHLKTLKKLGILKSQKNGKEVFYFLNKKYSCPKCQILKSPLFRL
jgi:DNA-binding transcriptional ArsR family regulator